MNLLDKKIDKVFSLDSESRGNGGTTMKFFMNFLKSNKSNLKGYIHITPSLTLRYKEGITPVTNLKFTKTPYYSPKVLWEKNNVPMLVRWHGKAKGFSTVAGAENWKALYIIMCNANLINNKKVNLKKLTEKEVKDLIHNTTKDKYYDVKLFQRETRESGFSCVMK